MSWILLLNKQAPLQPLYPLPVEMQQKTLDCPALPSSLRSEQTRCFVRHSQPSWLRACTKAAAVEIPLLPAQRHHRAHTIGIANVENEMCAEVIWKILTLLLKGSMITIWQREGLVEVGWGGRRVFCRSNSLLERLSVLAQQTLLEWGWCFECWEELRNSPCLVHGRS